MRQEFKLAVMVIAIGLVIVMGTAVTLSYLLADAPPIKNEFEPVEVDCLVENGGTDGNYSNISVRNTGDITAYIRAHLIVNWVSEANGNILSDAPKDGVDYTLTVMQGAWKKGTDGHYYYLLPVEADNSTDVLASVLTEINEREGYKLTLMVIASAVQAKPTEAVEGFWSVDVLDNGSLSVQ